MAERRGYGDPCGIARGLDVVGTRWALLVVRELLLGPKRFGDLRAGLPGMSAETLGQRLRQLEEEGVVRRTTLPPPASVPVYELTDWGHELRPVILALGRWGSQAPFPPGDAALSPDSMMLALPTMFDPARAHGVDATYGVRLGEHAFRVRVEGGELDLARGGADEADAVITTDTVDAAGAAVAGSAGRAGREGRHARDRGQPPRGAPVPGPVQAISLAGPNQAVSASASPRRSPSPTQATYPSGRISTAAGSGDLPQHRKLPRTGVLRRRPPGPGRPTARCPGCRAPRGRAAPASHRAAARRPAPGRRR